jgi:hypothetical protein
VRERESGRRAGRHRRALLGRKGPGETTARALGRPGRPPARTRGCVPRPPCTARDGAWWVWGGRRGQNAAAPPRRARAAGLSLPPRVRAHRRKKPCAHAACAHALAARGALGLPGPHGRLWLAVRAVHTCGPGEGSGPFFLFRGHSSVFLSPRAGQHKRNGAPEGPHGQKHTIRMRISFLENSRANSLVNVSPMVATFFWCFFFP